MKPGVLPNETVDYVALSVVWIISERDIRLDGARRLGRKVGAVVGPENRLTSHDDDLSVFGNSRGGSEKVRRLHAVHEARRLCSCIQDLRTSARSLSSRRPANGAF